MLAAPDQDYAKQQEGRPGQTGGAEADDGVAESAEVVEQHGASELPCDEDPDEGGRPKARSEEQSAGDDNGAHEAARPVIPGGLEPLREGRHWGPRDEEVASEDQESGGEIHCGASEDLIGPAAHEGVNADLNGNDDAGEECAQKAE